MIFEDVLITQRNFALSAADFQEKCPMLLSAVWEKIQFPNTTYPGLGLLKKVTMPKIIYSRHNEILLAMLRGLRVERRLRQTDLAVRLGRDQGLVSKVERGERRLDVIELRDWLNALDSDFLGFVSSLDAELRLHSTTDPQLTRRRGTTRAPA